MGDPRSYQFDLDPAKRPARSTLAAQWYPGVRDAVLRASSSRIFDPITGIRAVVVRCHRRGAAAPAPRA